MSFTMHGNRELSVVRSEAFAEMWDYGNFFEKKFGNSFRSVASILLPFTFCILHSVFDVVQILC